MIDLQLITQLQLSYPSGNTDAPEKSALDNNGLDIKAQRLSDVLFGAQCYSSLAWDLRGRLSKINTLIINLKGDPPFSDWQSWDKPQKLAWIKENQAPYPVLRVTLSRVAHYYYYHFNHWVARGDTGYLDIQLERDDHTHWEPHIKLIEEILSELGYKLFPKERNTELVPGFVSDGYDAIPDNDPRWDDDDFVPPEVPAILWDCLFEY